MLRDHAELRFEQLMPVRVDYSTYAGRAPAGGRFAVAVHLLSVTHNWRLRLRCMPADEELPLLPSLHEIWPSVNWYEREAFDLFGIVFDGHPDLRRILTDYGFAGHPFRKDFPLSGNVACATTRSRSAWSTSRSASSRAKSRRASCAKRTTQTRSRWPKSATTP